MSSRTGASSSSGLPSFTRALSPAVAGTVLAETSAGTVSERREAALALARSFDDVVQTVPVDYREVLRVPLREIYDTAGRWCEVKGQLARLQQHQAAGTYPTTLSGKAPTLQLSKAFLEAGGDAPTFGNNVNAGYEQFRKDALAQQVAAKLAEVAFLEGKLKPETAVPKLMRLVAQHWATQLEARYKSPVYDNNVVDNEGNIVITDWVVFEPAVKLRDRMISGTSRLHHTCILLQENRVVREHQKREAKKSLKDAADVEMGDAQAPATTDESIADLRKSVAALRDSIKELSAKVRLSFPLNPDRTHSDVVLGKRPAREVQAVERQGQGQGRRPRFAKFGAPVLVGQTPASAFGRQGQPEEKVVFWDAEGQVRSFEGLVAHVRAAQWSYVNPLTYPDEILMLDAPTAISLLHERVPASVRQAARFRSRVFVGPGVFLPDYLAVHLSASLKYMLYSPPSVARVNEAWSDFKNRLRWRFHHDEEKAREGDLEVEELDPYDPDYDFPHDTPNYIGKCADYFEAGLTEGDRYVSQFTSEVVPSLKRSVSPFQLAEFDRLRQWLDEHDYIVTHTDKNLGIAVITKGWFVENTRKLWNDPACYEKITEAQSDLEMDKKHTAIRELAKHVEDVLGSKQLAKFLVHKCPSREEPHKPSALPEFYGIPKMHKLPVKMRPIVPCHSNAQAPVASYVSKQLKELVAMQPFILHGSKDLAQKLNKVELSRSRKAWIVSGDIVAYYPNIPLAPCINIVSKMWLDTIGNRLTAEERHAFLRAMQIANQNLVIKFDGEYAKQIKGLAMGIACSPDLANLYGAHFENDILTKEPYKSAFAFYGRYLDDLLGIVYANSADEALALARTIVYEGVEIEWAVSEWHTPFLDMFVYLDPITRRIEHKPYRKPLNHRERIPWASHHPKDVKRGTFVGEMSRLATLSSKPEHYSDAMQDLTSLYIARGYPTDLVKKWLKENYAERWENRLGVSKTGPRELFVLKSHFNPAWSAFNVHELGQKVVTTWLSGLQKLEDIERQRRRREQSPRVSPEASSTRGSDGGNDGGSPPASPPGSPPELVQFSLERFWGHRHGDHEFKREESSPPPEAAEGGFVAGSPVSLSYVDPAGSRHGSSAPSEQQYGREISLEYLTVSERGTPASAPPRSATSVAGSAAQSPPPAPLPDGWRMGPLIPTGRILPVRGRNAHVVEYALDIRSVGYNNREWIVSRKRNKNIADLASAWKKSVLNKVADEDVIAGHLDEWL